MSANLRDTLSDYEGVKSPSHYPREQSAEGQLPISTAKFVNRKIDYTELIKVYEVVNPSLAQSKLEYSAALLTDDCHVNEELVLR